MFRSWRIPAVFAFALCGSAAAGEMQLNIQIPRLDVAEYHRPYVAAWIEREDSSVAGQLLVWYQQDTPSLRKGENATPADDGRKWLRDLRQWWRRIGRASEQSADGTASATRPPATHRLQFAADHPALKELTAGDYRLVVEAVREVGGREVLKLDFRWPPQQTVEQQVEGRSELGRIDLKLIP